MQEPMSAGVDDGGEDMSTRGIPVDQLPRSLFVAITLTLFVPFVAVSYVSWKIVTNQFSGLQLATLVIFLIFSLLGTGLGIHRYFSHRTFDANRGLKYLLGILACSGGIGQVTWFAAVHRRHHRFGDSPRDPHTPHFPAFKNATQFLQTAWLSAFGFSYRFGLHGYYLLYPEKDVHGLTREFRASVRDLTDDADLRWIDRHYYLWMFLFFLLPGLCMLAVTGKPQSFWDGVIWGGVARMGFNQLIFATINVAGHSVGAQPYRSGDQSRNLYFLALFSNGETLHNNHHAFPWTAKTCLAWWQIDLNYYFLLLFKALGWARNVRIPTADEVAKKRCTAN
jgi:stearoyl-CoA desaturase (delta-9 desaturase)